MIVTASSANQRPQLYEVTYMGFHAKKRRSSAVCHDCHYHLLSFRIFHEFNPLAAIQYLDLLLAAIKNETY